MFGIGEVLSLVFGGGATGLLGSAITSFTNFKLQKLKNDQDVKMHELDIALLKQEAQSQIEVQECATEGQVQLAEIDALKASYDAAAQDAFIPDYMDKLYQNKWTIPIGALLSTLFGIVDFLRKGCRPILTYYLMIVSTYLTWLSWTVLQASTGDGGALDMETATVLFNSTMKVMMYLTVTCVSWWFGDRRTAKFMMRLNDGNAKTS
ncbi:MAG TPA: hypothetical protein VMW36_09520 [Patescibacteria group bacterium]|nr:hypothetical protein [Patescibacteria group bacterium]